MMVVVVVMVKQQQQQVPFMPVVCYLLALLELQQPYEVSLLYPHFYTHFTDAGTEAHKG